MEPVNQQMCKQGKQRTQIYKCNSGPQEPWIVLETVQEFSTSDTRVLLSSVASTPQKGLGYFRERTT